MKRAVAVLASATVAVLCLAGTALAATNPPHATTTPTVLGKHTTHGSTAFTGANLSVGIATLAALVFIGLLALGLARRRAATRG